MKAQTYLQVAAIGGIAAGIALLATKKPQPDETMERLNGRIRDGIMPLDSAIKKFADNACYISEARWLLCTEPFSRWKVAWMGLSRDVIFDKKYEHGYVIVYDAHKRPFMAIHTMPNDRSPDPLPNAMGDRNCVIDIFPVTIDASDALCEKRGHDDIVSPDLIPLQDPSYAAARLRSFMLAVRDAAFPYTVPVQPVKNELLSALRDDTTLSDFPDHKRAKAIARRARARQWIERHSDASLARLLNPATKYRLSDIGLNSNSGIVGVFEVLGHKHKLDMVRAPFSENSLWAAVKERAAARLASVERQAVGKPARTILPTFTQSAGKLAFA